MKISKVLAMLLLAAGSLAAQQFTFTPLPPSENILNQHFGQQPGCACYVPGNGTSQYPWSLLNNIQVSPTRVVATVGQPVQIRYDASAICMGQTIRDSSGKSVPNNGPLGSATWEVGAVQALPDVYGLITFTGYQQPVTDNIVITLNPQCYDTGAKCTMPNKYSQCSATVTIPVVILAANTPPQAVQALRSDSEKNWNDAFFKPEERKKAAEAHRKVKGKQKSKPSAEKKK